MILRALGNSFVKNKNNNNEACHVEIKSSTENMLDYVNVLVNVMQTILMLLRKYEDI